MVSTRTLTFAHGGDPDLIHACVKMICSPETARNAVLGSGSQKDILSYPLNVP